MPICIDWPFRNISVHIVCRAFSMHSTCNQSRAKKRFFFPTKRLFMKQKDKNAKRFQSHLLQCMIISKALRCLGTTITNYWIHRAINLSSITFTGFNGFIDSWYIFLTDIRMSLWLKTKQFYITENFSCQALFFGEMLQITWKQEVILLHIALKI